MNSIRNETGIYALVMKLEKGQTITFDKKGTHQKFALGYYVYIGSARGPGGLKSRVRRHQNRRVDGKRMHWNVDYFRELAPIGEVWYSYTQSDQLEHDWAQSIARMYRASVPFAGFGTNDCGQGCDAHFFYFSERPFVAGFRAVLGPKRHKPPEVLVSFSDDASCGSVEVESPLLCQYLRGRRFQELRRHAIHGSKIGATGWKSLAKGKPARELMESIAVDSEIAFDQLKAAAELADAADTIVSNCGEEAIQAMFYSQRPQIATKILKLSRKSREVQRHRVFAVLDPNSRAWSLAPQGREQIVDTMNFDKIINRLDRARGVIERSRELLGNCLLDRRHKRWIAGVEATIRQVESVVKVHKRGVAQLGVREAQCGKRTTSTPSKKMSLDRVPIQLKAAAGLLEKNVRDMPRSSYDLRPTPDQVKVIGRETARIQRGCRCILEMIRRDVRPLRPERAELHSRADSARS
jgi:Uri superfamily endonuclease